MVLQRLHRGGRSVEEGTDIRECGTRYVLPLFRVSEVVRHVELRDYLDGAERVETHVDASIFGTALKMYMIIQQCKRES